MAYEVFAGKHSGKSGRCSPSPRVTIGSGRVLTLNRSAMRAIGSPLCVILLWDSEARRIGIIPTGTEDATAFNLHRNNNRSSGQVTSGAFVTKIGLQATRVSLNAFYDSGANMLMASLP